MRNKYWLWLMFSTPVWAAQDRDPFEQPLVTSCVLPAASPANWQLKGTIGEPGLRHGWLMTPQGQWLRLQPQQTLLDGLWQVVQIQARQLEFSEVGTERVCPLAKDNIVLTLGEP
jgi:pilus assembly protein HofP